MRSPVSRPKTSPEDTTAVQPPPLVKRGRKPGPLSRAAREAQRRLNHSIIEKARRTKINDALATLKQLVPPGYGQKPDPQAEDEGEEEGEDEDEDFIQRGGSKPKMKSKSTGKKEEKEKEFKLEILVRTVSFLQDLLERVKNLEENTANVSTTPSVCSKCTSRKDINDKKRKLSLMEAVDDSFQEIDSRYAKVPRQSSGTSYRTLNDASPQLPHDTGSHSSQFQSVHHPEPFELPTPPLNERLPSISSWLHSRDIDPEARSPLPYAYMHSSNSSGVRQESYLPSPPNSTHFDPVRSSTIPPLLNLGPVAIATMDNITKTNTNRTPEDESAASSLLQIASSPTFLPVPSSKGHLSSSSGSRLPDPSNFVLHERHHVKSFGDHPYSARQAQTPSSILGMTSSTRRY